MFFGKALWKLGWSFRLRHALYPGFAKALILNDIADKCQGLYMMLDLGCWSRALAVFRI